MIGNVRNEKIYAQNIFIKHFKIKMCVRQE